MDCCWRRCPKRRGLLRRYNNAEGQYELLTSIPGIGPVIAGWLPVYTAGFSRFATARQLACFAGSAPFPRQSGQQKGPERVSQWRCVRLKTLLLNGVHLAVQHDPELRACYRRKCAEGKHPQSVRNAVICKLLYRVFAVINRGTPYVKLHQHGQQKPLDLILEYAEFMSLIKAKNVNKANQKRHNRGRVPS